MLIKIKLLKRHRGRRPGRVVEVDDLRARRMVETGVGEPAGNHNGGGRSPASTEEKK